jgi:hypothetical protein
MPICAGAKETVIGFAFELDSLSAKMLDSLGAKI